MRALIITLLLLTLLVAGCGSDEGYADFSTPKATLDTLKEAASREDVPVMYEAFSDAFKQETGVSYELYVRSLEAQPDEFTRIEAIEVDQTFDQGNTVIMILDDGDRMFFINEKGLWKIRLIGPAP